MTLSNLAKENKLIAIMGDFNIDLLKYDNNTPTNDYQHDVFLPFPAIHTASNSHH